MSEASEVNIYSFELVLMDVKQRVDKKVKDTYYMYVQIKVGHTYLHLRHCNLLSNFSNGTLCYVKYICTQGKNLLICTVCTIVPKTF